MQQKTLQQLIDRVAYEAGIDGQVTTTGRHSFANLTLLFNEYWDSVLALASNNGQDEAREATNEAGTAIPAAVNNEVFCIIPWPATAVDICGVDVFAGGSDGWIDLDPAKFANRRNLQPGQGRLGHWAVKKLPKENGAGVTAGEVALFDSRVIAGMLHKVYFREAWLPIAAANTGFTIIGYPDWFQWAQNSMIQVITKRDTNKKDTFQAATLLKNEAEARIRDTSKNRQRSGPRVPMRRDGMEL